VRGAAPDGDARAADPGVAVAVDDRQLQADAVWLRRRRLRERRLRPDVLARTPAACEDGDPYEDGCGSSSANGSNVPSGPAVSTSCPKKRVM
jgi:hypothetical protein